MLKLHQSLALKRDDKRRPVTRRRLIKQCCINHFEPMHFESTHFESNIRKLIVRPRIRQSILAWRRPRPKVRQQTAAYTVKGRFMEKLSAEDALEARRLADQLGLRKLSDQDLVKLLNAARVANVRRDALDISGLTPADEPALVFRLPATGQSL
jgi:hypothetical protein